MTNASGQMVYDYSKLKAGQYTYKAYHIEDNYYTYIETTGAFSVKNYNIVVLDNQTLNYDEAPVTVRLNATINDSETGDVINPDSVFLTVLRLKVPTVRTDIGMPTGHLKSQETTQ